MKGDDEQHAVVRKGGSRRVRHTGETYVYR